MEVGHNVALVFVACRLVATSGGGTQCGTGVVACRLVATSGGGTQCGTGVCSL